MNKLNYAYITHGNKGGPGGSYVAVWVDSHPHLRLGQRGNLMVFTGRAPRGEYRWRR